MRDIPLCGLADTYVCDGYAYMKDIPIWGITPIWRIYLYEGGTYKRDIPIWGSPHV